MFVHLSRRNRRKREMVYASLFTAFLFSTLLLSLVYLATANTWVLGTEMNTNGLVEYLCLGRGCEELY